MTPKQDFGAVLGSVLEPGPSRATLASQRSRVIAAMQGATRKRQGQPVRLIVVVAAVALVLVAISSRVVRPTGLIGVWNGQELTEHALVNGRSGPGGVLRFSDGTRVQVARSTELRLSRLGPNVVELALGSGLIHAQVAKETGRSWLVLAGPYRVQVVGTDFSVEWDSSAREIDVRVIEGRVLVFGFELPAGGVALEAGARFHRRASTPPALPAPPAEQENAAVAAAAAATTASARAAAASGAPRMLAARPADASAAAADWRELASAQRYSEAIAAARELGFERLLPTLSDKDLLLLANTARYAGALADAQRALLELRVRFPKSPSATVAALVLAGIQERAKNSTEAARWLRMFLAESPNGELSAGARARLLAILVRAGQRSEARRVAADYLRYHPDGPYVTEARGVLDSGTLP